MAASLLVAGSGDAFNSGGRFHTCLLLRGGEEPVMLDCGASGLVALKRAGVDPAQIGHVALTHLHGDHFGGLPFLVLDGQFSGRRRALVIAGPPGTEERVQQAFEVLYPGSSEAQRAFSVSFATLAAGSERQVGPAAVTAFSVTHPSGAPAYALRVRYAGKVVAYSGDTGWTDSLVAAADGADLFVCECNFHAKEVPNHLDYRTLVANRERLRCRQIVLTHLGPEMLAHVDEARAEGFGVAQDGAVLAL